MTRIERVTVLLALAITACEVNHPALDAGPDAAVELDAHRPDSHVDPSDAGIDAVTPPICEPPELRCSGGVLERCAEDGGAWEELETCAAGSVCVAEACSAIVCVPAATRCVDGTTTSTCDETGTAENEAACATGTYCDDGACTPQVCEPGTSTCTGPSERSTCDAVGSASTATACGSDERCTAGMCVPRVCTPSARSCGDDDTVIVCDAEGGASSMIECGAGAYCEAGSCLPQVCAPGATTCGDASTLRTCDARGSGFVDSACDATRACDAGACQMLVCTASARTCADPFTVSACNTLGTAAATSACASGTYCAAGTCLPQVCTPGATLCGGFSTLRTCDVRGSAYVDASCGASESCVGGACVVRTCAPDARSCDGDFTVRICDASGTSSSTSSCASGTYCSAGSCVPQTCTPDSATCASSTGLARCDSRGSGTTTTPCAADQRCAAGACIACTTTLVSADFEATTAGARPSGWMDGCMAGSTYAWSVGTQAHAGARALTMDFRGSGGEAAVGIPVTWPTTGIVDVSFWFRPETTSQNIYILPVRGNQRLFNALPFERFGTLQGTSIPYSAGTWYRVEYAIDFDLARFEMRVDGTVIRTGAFASASLPCTLAGGDYLSFHGGYVDQKWLGQLDDLQITRREPVCAPPAPSRAALSFDGDGDQVQFPMSFGDVGNRFTFEAWVRPTSTTAGMTDEGGTVFTHRADCADYWLGWSGIGARTGRFWFTIYPDAGCGSQVSVEAPFTSSIDAWHHVAGVFDSGQVRLYVDGQPAGSTTLSLPITWSTRLLGHWAGRDGADARATRGAIRAHLDEIRVSDTARYAAPFTPPEHLESDASTVGAWLFDEGSGTTTQDASASNFDGTITGATWVSSTR